MRAITLPFGSRGVALRARTRSRYASRGRCIVQPEEGLPTSPTSRAPRPPVPTSSTSPLTSSSTSNRPPALRSTCKAEGLVAVPPSVTKFPPNLPPAMRVPEQLAWSPTETCLAQLVGRRSNTRPAFPIPLQFRACCRCVRECLECRDSQLGWVPSPRSSFSENFPGSLSRTPSPSQAVCR